MYAFVTKFVTHDVTWSNTNPRWHGYASPSFQIEMETTEIPVNILGDSSTLIT